MNANNSALIDLQSVVKTYVTPAGSFPALKGINLRIAAGELVSIVGKSGSGKSTLLNILTGIDRPSSGSVIAGQTQVHTLSESRGAHWRGRNVGIVFQFFQLLPTLTVLENIVLAMEFSRVIPRRERLPRAQGLLDQVGIGDQAKKLPATLSGGQQQRAALARALANDPVLIVADEPTGNLDSATAKQIFGLLKSQAAAGKTVVIVTHDRDLAAQTSRVIALADGRICDGEA